MSELKLPSAEDETDPAVPTGGVWNRTVAAVERQARLAVEAPLELDDGPQGQRIRLSTDLADIRPVRISGTATIGSNGSAQPYNFVQQNFDTNGAAVDLPYAWTQTNTGGVAFEINGAPLPNSCTNTSALLLQTFDNTSGQPVYLFQAPAPVIIAVQVFVGSPEDGPPWTYSGTQVFPGDGYGTWTTSNTSIQISNLYNIIEDQTFRSGSIAGNGVNSANLPPGYSIQPIPSGTIVLAIMITGISGAQTWWCQYENGVDGTCETG